MYGGYWLFSDYNKQVKTSLKQQTAQVVMDHTRHIDKFVQTNFRRALTKI